MILKNNLIGMVVRAGMVLATVSFAAVSCKEDNPDTPVPEEPAAYNIGVTDITTWTATVSIAPEDSLASYWSGIVTKHVYDSLGTSEALVEMELDALKEAADLYGEEHTSYISSKSKRGESSRKYKGLTSETAYYAFAFTLSEDCLSGNEVCLTPFTTAAAEAVDCMFSIDISNVTKTGAGIKIIPSNTQCTYFCDYLTTAEYKNYGGDKGIETANVDLIRRAVEIYQMAGYDRDFSDFLYTGTVTANPSSLVSGVDYTVFAFGLDPSGTVTTELYVKTFRTEAPEQSSLTFKTEVFDLKFNGAKIGFSPSNDDETYFTDCMDYETFSSFESEQDVIAWVISQAGSSINSFLAQGYHIVDASSLLSPETKYVAYAFGYNNGATTSLATVEFTTPAMQTGSDASVSVDYKIVDAGTINSAYEGQTAVYITLTPSSSAEHWYVALFNSLEDYADSKVVEALMANGYKDRKEAAFIIDPAKSYVIGAVAVDASDVTGNLVKVDVPATSGTSALKLARPSLESLRLMDIR